MKKWYTVFNRYVQGSVPWGEETGYHAASYNASRKVHGFPLRRIVRHQLQRHLLCAILGIGVSGHY